MILSTGTTAAAASVAAWPAPLKTFVLALSVSPTAYLFADIWREAGMYKTIARMVVTYHCA